MAKLTKAIQGVANGEVYPREFAAGEECPPELEEAARALGALGKKGAAAPAAEPDASVEGE